MVTGALNTFLDASALGEKVKVLSTLPHGFSERDLDKMFANFIIEDEALHQINDRAWANMLFDINHYFDHCLAEKREKLLREEHADAAMQIVAAAATVAGVFLSAIPFLGFCVDAAALSLLAGEMALEADIRKLRGTIIHDLIAADTNIRKKNSHFDTYNRYANARDSNSVDLKRLKIGKTAEEAHDMVLGYIVAVRKLNDGKCTVPLLKQAFVDAYNADMDDSISPFIHAVVQAHTKFHEVVKSGKMLPAEESIYAAITVAMAVLPTEAREPMCMAALAMSSTAVVRYFFRLPGIMRYYNATRQVVALTARKFGKKLSTLVYSEDGVQASKTTAALDEGVGLLSSEENSVIYGMQLETEGARMAGGESKLFLRMSKAMKFLQGLGAICLLVVGILEVNQAAKLDWELRRQFSKSKYAICNFYHAVLDIPNYNFPALPERMVNGADALQIKAMDANDWAQGVVGQFSWTCKNGTLDARRGCMDSVISRHVSTVLCSGTASPVLTTTYICVGGEGARFVELTLSPSGTFHGWDGSKWVTDYATATRGSDGKDYYWYKTTVVWYNINSFNPPAASFSATASRASGNDRSNWFRLWAWEAEAKDAKVEPTPPFHEKAHMVTGSTSQKWAAALLAQDEPELMDEFSWNMGCKYNPGWSMALPLTYSDGRDVVLTAKVNKTASHSIYVCTTAAVKATFGVEESGLHVFDKTYKWVDFSVWDGTTWGQGKTPKAYEEHYWYKLTLSISTDDVGRSVQLKANAQEDFSCWIFKG